MGEKNGDGSEFPFCVLGRASPEGVAGGRDAWPSVFNVQNPGWLHAHGQNVPPRVKKARVAAPICSHRMVSHDSTYAIMKS